MDILVDASVALFLSIGTTILLELQIRIRRAILPRDGYADTDDGKGPLTKGLRQMNSILAYGAWIRVYRIVALVVAVCASVALAAALLA